MREELRECEEGLIQAVIDAAFEVHRRLGPGLLESVYEFAPIHMAQVINYLKLLKFKRGYLLNFNKRFLKDGIRRVSI